MALKSISRKKQQRDGLSAYARFDFKRTFPNVFWVSTVSFDSEAPDGFRFKIFTIRREPEQMIELVILRQMEDGTKRLVTQMEAPIGNFGVMDDVVQELTNVANVDFERFDLSTIRTFDEFQSRAIDLGWESAHNE